MALKFKNHIFFHNPKCGGSFIRRTIEASTKPNTCEEIGKTHATPFELQVSGVTLMPWKCFTSVRHPVTWYESYFRYRTMPGTTRPWQGHSYFDKCVKADTYEEFIRRVLRHTLAGSTSIAGHIYAPYLVPNNYVLRLENLEKGLKKIFDLYRIPFKHLKPIKVSPKSISTKISKELYDRLVEQEAGLADTLGYPKYPEK